MCVFVCVCVCLCVCTCVCARACVLVCVGSRIRSEQREFPGQAAISLRDISCHGPAAKVGWHIT